MSFKGTAILKRNTPSVKPVAGNPQQPALPTPAGLPLSPLKRRTERSLCHPERSEGSAFLCMHRSASPLLERTKFFPSRLRAGAAIRRTERVWRNSMESDEGGSPRARERFASSFWPRETRPYTGTPRVRGKAAGMLPLPFRESAGVRGCPGMTVKWGKTRCRAASHAANATPRIRRRYHCQPSRTETLCATACPGCSARSPSMLRSSNVLKAQRLPSR